MENPIWKDSQDGDASKGRCWMRIGVNRRYKSSDGKYKLEVYPVLVWGNHGKACADNLEKGQEVTVFGEPHINGRALVDASGQPIVGTNGKQIYSNDFELVAEHVSFGRKKKEQEEKGRATVTAAAPASAPVADTNDAQLQRIVDAVAAKVLAAQAAPQEMPPDDDPLGAMG